MTKYGSWEGAWVGTGIAPLPATPVRTTPGTPPLDAGPACTHGYTGAGGYHGLNMAVGLKSVAQLTLSVHFSRFRGMTEVYNLMRIGRINNH